jgi:hypothetical protein
MIKKLEHITVLINVKKFATNANDWKSLRLWSFKNGWNHFDTHSFIRTIQKCNIKVVLETFMDQVWLDTNCEIYLIDKQVKSLLGKKEQKGEK